MARKHPRESVLVSFLSAVNTIADLNAGDWSPVKNLPRIRKGWKRMDTDGPMRSIRFGYDFNPSCPTIYFRADTAIVSGRQSDTVAGSRQLPQDVDPTSVGTAVPVSEHGPPAWQADAEQKRRLQNPRGARTGRTGHHRREDDVTADQVVKTGPQVHHVRRGDIDATDRSVPGLDVPPAPPPPTGSS
jgi:hypothetical protein